MFSKLNDKEQEKNKISWLDKIQSLDYHTKTKLLVILSILAIGFVVFVWGAYFNFMLAQLNESETAETQNNQVNFISKIKGGTAFVLDSANSFLRYLSNILNAPREYIIK